MSVVRRACQSKWMWVLTGTVVGIGLSGGLIYRQHRAQLRRFPRPPAPIATAASEQPRLMRHRRSRGLLAAAPTPAITQTAWIPEINGSKPPGAAPAGMIVDSWRPVLDGNR